MAVAQNLKAMHTVDERVMRVANTVVAIDNRLADVNNQSCWRRVARAAHIICDGVRGVRE